MGVHLGHHGRRLVIVVLVGLGAQRLDAHLERLVLGFGDQCLRFAGDRGLVFGSRMIGDRLTRHDQALEDDLGSSIELQRFDDDVVASLGHALVASIDCSTNSAGALEGSRAVGEQHRELDRGTLLVCNGSVQDQRVLLDPIEETIGQFSDVVEVCWYREDLSHCSPASLSSKGLVCSSSPAARSSSTLRSASSSRFAPVRDRRTPSSNIARDCSRGKSPCSNCSTTA